MKAVMRTALTKVDTKEIGELERIKLEIKDSFQRAFKAKSCADLCQIIRLLKHVYYMSTEVENGLDKYYRTFRSALEITCEKSTDKDAHMNCLKMCAHVALALSKDGVPKPLQTLVDFCIEMSDLCLVVTRCYVCFLAGLLLNLDKLITSRYRDKTPSWEQCSPLSSDMRTALYNVLTYRLLDVDPLVRVEAIKAVATLQDECTGNEVHYDIKSPKRLVMRHLDDIASECRITVVKKLLMTSKEELDMVVQVALCDSEIPVRREAVMRILKDADLKSLSIKQRMDLVQSVLSLDENKNRRQILNELLSSWLNSAYAATISPEDSEMYTFYCAVSSHLLRFLEPLTQEQTSHDLLLAAFRYCREHMGLSSTEVHEFVVSLIKNADDILLHRHNHSKLLEEGWTALEQANAVFYWRCLLDFCKTTCSYETDWSECYYRLLPTMFTFCEVTQKYTELNLSYEDNEALSAFRRFAVMQLLKMVTLFEESDTSGWNRWRSLCEWLLCNMQLK